DGPRYAPAPRPALVTAAFALAAGQMIAGLWAAHFGRFAQLGYVAVLAAPSLVLLSASRRPSAREDGGAPMRWVVAIALAWMVLRLTLAWHSPRTADAVDTLGGLTYLEQTMAPGFNLLTDGPLTGVSSLFLVFQGAGFFDLVGAAPSLRVVQVL